MSEKEEKVLVKAPEAKPAIVDTGDFANFMDTARFEHLWRIATLFSKTELVPTHYRGKPENCLIAIEMAMRMGVAPLPFLQNTYIVHGRPGIEAKLAISLINSSGMFVDSLDYEVEGDDPHKDGYRVRAYAVKRSTGKTVLGPWVDWEMVKKEGWLGKEGSKWKTMPAIMFAYRAAMFFGRLHCPERLLGMQTVDEIQDVGPREVIDVTPPATLEQQVGLKPAAAANRPAVEPKAKAQPKAKPEKDQNHSSNHVEKPEPVVEGPLTGPRLELHNLLGTICRGDEAAMSQYLAFAIKRKIAVGQIGELNDEAALEALAKVREQQDIDASFASKEKE